VRVLIVVPRFVSKGDFYQFPLGLGYIASAVRRSGHSVFGLNLNHSVGLESELVAEEVKRLSIDACLTGGLSPFLATIRKVFTGSRHGNRHIMNIAGGGVVSGDPEVSLDLMDIDVGVVGEGEVTITEVLNAYERGTDLIQVPGIVYKDSKGNVVHTPERAPIRDLTQIAWPDYDLLGFKEHLHLQRPLDHHFFQTQPDNKPRAIDMIASRSCPFMCTFCFHPIGKVYRERPLDDFFNELKHYIDKYEINMVAILDELFSLRKERLLEFCERIKPLNLRWMVQLHVRTADEHILNAMADAGCSYISYGIESMSGTVLRSMGKKSRPAEIATALEQTYNSNIGIQGNLIFGDAAETLETANETMSWWARNRKYGIYLSRLQVFPGSPDYIMAIQNGLITDRSKFCEELPRDLNISSMNSTNLSEMLFQLRVHGTTLLNLVAVKHFEKSETQVEGRNTASDIVWDCPRCQYTNNYRQCVLRKEHCHFIRLFCRRCRSRWDILNKAFDHHPPLVPYVYKKERTRLKEIQSAGGELLKEPFDPGRHVRFANALREVGAFGAARLHYQQAIDLCVYWSGSGVTCPVDKYRNLLRSLMSDPKYSERSETYFVSH